MSMQKIFLLGVYSIAITACVSVNMPSNSISRADKVNFDQPALPFSPIKTESADKAWQSNKTGNTMAYLSECGAGADTQLKTLESETLSALSNINVLKTELRNFNGREAIETTAEGRVDGVTVKIALLVFKKNGCNFSLSLMGRKTQFDSEAAKFESFKQSFVVP